MVDTLGIFKIMLYHHFIFVLKSNFTSRKDLLIVVSIGMDYVFPAVLKPYFSVSVVEHDGFRCEVLHPILLCVC